MAYNAMCVNGRVRPGDVVVVLGPGPIGLLCALMAKLCGVGHLIVAGLPADSGRLQIARALGADATLDGAIEQYIGSVGDGLGADVVVDASGSSASLEMALRVVRPVGQILKVGWGPQPLQFSLDPLVQKNVMLQGSFSHNWPIWERVISMIASGQIPLDLILSRVDRLSEWETCFKKMQIGEYVKAILTPAEG